MKVLKFGGVAVGSPEPLERVTRIVADARPCMVVTSAASGTTDRLADLARDPPAAGAVGEALAPIRQRHGQLLRGADDAHRREAQARVDGELDAISTVLSGADSAARLDDAERARVLAAGERMMAPILAAHLETLGLPAKARSPREVGLVAQGDRDRATVRLDEAMPVLEDRARAWIEQGRVPVVPGFYAPHASGGVALLGRGGSDHTAAVCAAGLDADALVLYKDVPGIMTADPRRFPEARAIPEMTYIQADVAALRGASVLHPATIPALEASAVPLHVRGIRDPDHPGTLVHAEPHPARTAATVVVEDRAPVLSGSTGKQPSNELVDLAALERPLSAVTLVRPFAQTEPSIDPPGTRSLVELELPVPLVFASSGGVSSTFFVPSQAVADCVDALHQRIDEPAPHVQAAAAGPARTA